MLGCLRPHRHPEGSVLFRILLLSRAPLVMPYSDPPFQLELLYFDGGRDLPAQDGCHQQERIVIERKFTAFSKSFMHVSNTVNLLETLTSENRPERRKIMATISWRRTRLERLVSYSSTRIDATRVRVVGFIIYS
jgi:hypothetical protein